MYVLPVLLKDGYKVGHIFQYPKDTTLVYSNYTPRGCRVPGVKGVINFGEQAAIKEYLIDQFTNNFFNRSRDVVLKEYKRRIDNYLGPGISVDHIGALHELGYLPLHVKALPEGVLVPHRVPVLTIYNTLPEFYWLTNMVETLLSCVLWGPITSATTAFRYRKEFEKYALLTGAPKEFIPWQGHDFSFRGMFGVEAAILSGMGHLTSFTGTDTIPAIDGLEYYYGADCEKELIGGSVPATEHSVMEVGLQNGELQLIERLITEVYPKGILSIVCDTWDFWKVLTEYLPALKDKILARDGKVVVRPDSGDPVKIINGDPVSSRMEVAKGALRVLWETFGGTNTEKGYKVLDPHIGIIYGDSITPERQTAILEGMLKNGFASSNIVLGIGSYTYQYVTRDVHGFALKATYVETKSEGGKAIFKKPLTDDGTKYSAKGLLSVHGGSGNYYMSEQNNWEYEGQGELKTIFRNGKLVNTTTLAEIRHNVEANLAQR